jgi:hypothetical protein
MKLGTPRRIAASQCLHCGETLDGATSIDMDDAPDPGDITVCLLCGHIMAFADDMTLREPTDAEAKDAAGDPRILAIQAARRGADRKP